MPNSATPKERPENHLTFETLPEEIVAAQALVRASRGIEDLALTGLAAQPAPKIQTIVRIALHPDLRECPARRPAKGR